MSALLLVLILLLVCAKCDDRQNYREQLLIRQLPDSNILAHFEHAVSWNKSPIHITTSSTSNVHHYGMFPKSIAEVVSHYNVQELHLSLTRGIWKHRSWGYPPVDSPPGAEIWAWFSPMNMSAESQWSGILNGVSGFMCSSLNSIDTTSTYRPLTSFKPEGALLVNESMTFIRYAALPREAVCTENLTPWSKLLPCGQKVGLGSLYDAINLFDSLYFSLSLKVVPVCQDSDCLSVGTSVYQTLSVVIKPADVSHWSLRSLFGRQLSSVCPISSSTLVFIDVTSNIPSVHSLTPPLSATKHVTIDGADIQLAVIELNTSTELPLNIELSYSATERKNHNINYPPLLEVHRYLTGSGHERGGLEIVTTNRHTNASPTVSIFDMVPWYFRLLYHTFNISCTYINGSNCDHDLVVLYSKYTPAKDRYKSHSSEYIIKIPPLSAVTFSVQFLRAFLKWNEHPPDSSHGFYINSVVLTAVLSPCSNCTHYPTLLPSTATNQSQLVKIHSEILLVSLPIPDFSMPYNVICFISTAVAIGFGSLFNLTTKKFVKM